MTSATGDGPCPGLCGYLSPNCPFPHRACAGKGAGLVLKHGVTMSCLLMILRLEGVWYLGSLLLCLCRTPSCVQEPEKIILTTGGLICYLRRYVVTRIVLHGNNGGKRLSHGQSRLRSWSSAAWQTHSKSLGPVADVPRGIST